MSSFAEYHIPDSAKVYAPRLARWESLPDGLTFAAGEAGDGVYAFFSRDSRLAKYYQDESRRLASFRLKEGRFLVDLTNPELVRVVLVFLAQQSQANLAGMAGGRTHRLTRTNFQRSYWGLMAIASALRASGAAGCIVPHVVPDLPGKGRLQRPYVGKQVVIFDIDSIA
jgi:hypothetical protein